MAFCVIVRCLGAVLRRLGGVFGIFQRVLENMWGHLKGVLARFEPFKGRFGGASGRNLDVKLRYIEMFQHGYCFWSNLVNFCFR